MNEVQLQRELTAEEIEHQERIIQECIARAVAVKYTPADSKISAIKVIDLQVAQAELLAQAFHMGQFDKAGHPYALHTAAVGESGTNWIEKILGYLHDAAEDHPELFKETDIADRFLYPSFFVGMLENLNKNRHGLPTDMDNSPFAKLTSNFMSLRTKINDSTHNGTIVRLGHAARDLMEVDALSRSRHYQRKAFSLLTSCNYKYGDNLDALFESMIYLSQLTNLRMVYEMTEDDVVSSINFSTPSGYGVESVDIATIRFFVGAYSVRSNRERVLKSGTYSYDQSKPVFERTRFIELVRLSK